MNLKKTYLIFEKKAKQIAQKCKVELPKTFYRYGIHECWKCKREIIVFAWPKDGLWDSKSPIILPLPKTIKDCGSYTVDEKYWINTCPYCHSVQGDFYLYMEPDGPFFGIHCENNTTISYIRDMLRIADYAKYIGLI